MGMKKACDVFGTTNGVKTYELSLKAVQDGEGDVLEKLVGDLGERAVTRLVKKMRDGMKPPSPKKAE